jgi:hypothetical protein
LSEEILRGRADESCDDTAEIASRREYEKEWEELVALAETPAKAESMRNMPASQRSELLDQYRAQRRDQLSDPRGGDTALMNADPHRQAGDSRRSRVES